MTLCWFQSIDDRDMHSTDYCSVLFLLHCCCLCCFISRVFTSCLNLMQVQQQQVQTVVFTIPIFEPLPSQYYVRVISDRWLGSEMTFPISFQHLILPEKHPPHTGLVNPLLLFSVLSTSTVIWWLLLWLACIKLAIYCQLPLQDVWGSFLSVHMTVNVNILLWSAYRWMQLL